MAHCIRRFCLLLLFCSILTSFLAVLPVSAAQNIKVGYYEDGDNMSRNIDGDYVGFNFEYLQEVAKYANWSYEVIDCKSWENAWKMLQSGEIDVLPAVYFAEERLDQCLFSALPMCNIYTTLNVRQDDTRYGFADYESFQGMRVGVISESKDAESFAEYCKTNQFQVEIIPYSETKDVLQDLEDKKLDGVAISHLGRNSIFRSVLQFAPEPIFVAVSKTKPQLLLQLDKAMDAMKLRDPYYESKLYDKYFSVSTKQRPVFTKEEKEYIKNNKEVRAIYDPNGHPLEFADHETGKFSGIIADLFALISQYCSIDFTYVPVATHGDAIKMVQNGEADILCSAGLDYLWASKNNINLTGYYLRVPVRMISNNTAGTGTRIALPVQYVLAAQIIEENPGKEVQYYDNTEACFEALLEGKADLTFADTYVANDLLMNEKYENFTAVTLMNFVEEMGIGLSKNADPALFSILDKCIQYTSNEQMNEIIFNHSNTEQKITLQALLREHPIETICIILSISLAIVLTLMYLLTVKSKNAKHIQNLLYCDNLTGLWNFNKFSIEVKERIKDMESYALVYVDINQFKLMNDTFGFAEGDKLLCTLGKLIENSMSQGECCARISADQFIMLCKFQSWDKLEERTAALNQELSEMRQQKSKRYQPVLAFGVYIIDKTEGEDTLLMVDFAKYALKRAKNTGIRKTVLYDETMRKQELERRHISDIMEEALANGEFRPYFQPKVNMATKKIVGAEALVRWMKPDGSMILPGEFIPLFEQNGFVIEIDMFMFEEVCKKMRRWLDEGREVPNISCNFSRLHFHNEQFPENLASIAKKYDIPTDTLDLEITESIAMEDMVRVQQHLGRLQEHGFLISIDDFGSGYSSLGILQELNADVLKLDRSFFKQEFSNVRDQAIIRAIITAAHELDMLIVCEGIETQAQSEMLLEMKCFVAQSFFYARPMPEEQFLARLDAQ